MSPDTLQMCLRTHKGAFIAITVVTARSLNYESRAASLFVTVKGCAESSEARNGMHFPYQTLTFDQT